MSLTFTDAQIKYTESLEKAGKANATVIAYSKDIEQLGEYLAKEKGITTVDGVTTENIDDFKENLKRLRYTSKSVSRKINSIKSFFRFLIGENYVQGNPATGVSHPKIEQSPPRVLTKTEYRALRDTARGDARMFAVIELLLQTGMRISELANLQLSDVDYDRDVITIQAQNSREARRIPMNAAAKNAIMDYLQVRPRAREKTLFLTKTCRPFLVRNIRTAIDRYFRLAAIRDAKVNDLRHTFVVEQLKAGTPLVYISQLVGHKRITTTEKYLQLVDTPEMSPSVQIEEL